MQRSTGNRLPLLAAMASMFTLGAGSGSFDTRESPRIVSSDPSLLPPGMSPVSAPGVHDSGIHPSDYARMKGPRNQRQRRKVVRRMTVAQRRHAGFRP